MRRKCGVSETPNFDYRAAQGNTALIPREGVWWPSREDNLIGARDIVSPSEFADLDMPESVGADIRLPRAPAHLAVVFRTSTPTMKSPFARPGTIPLSGGKLNINIAFSTGAHGGPFH